MFVAVGVLLAVGSQAFAFTPTFDNFASNVEGRRTIIAQDAQGNEVVLIAGQAYKLETNVLKAWAIRAKIFELQRQIASMPSDDCSQK